MPGRAHGKVRIPRAMPRAVHSRDGVRCAKTTRSGRSDNRTTTKELSTAHDKS
jgi:hypothetical protein